MAKKTESFLKIQNDILELIIFKMLSTNRAFAHSFMSIANEHIFSNNHFVTLFKIHQKYYETYTNTFKPLSIPGMRTLIKPENKELRSVLASIEKVNVDQFEEDLIIHNVDCFVRDRKIDYGALYIFTQSSKGEEYDIIRFQKLMNEAFNSSLMLDLGLDYFNDIEKRFEEKKLDLARSVDPGIKALQDNLIDTHGKLAPKTLTVINGQSNIGKSIVLGNIALNAWKTKKNVLIVTCEMSEIAYATRIDAALSKVNSREINDKQEKVIQKIKNEAGLRKGKSIRIKEFPTGTLTPATLKSYLTQLKSEFDFELVIVDYINIMESDRCSSVDSSYTKVKQVTEDLRSIAIIFDVPVVTATQLNRSGYNNGKPGMENTAESMGVVVTADVMLGIWQEKEDKIAGMLNSVIMKNRYGPNDIYFQMGIDYPTLRLIPEYEKVYKAGEFEKRKKEELATGSLAPVSQNITSCF